jgi:glycosyltransferase involved in cell wall biosynthesis
MHFVKKKGYRDYVMFSTWDEMDLGRKCLQYVHWVSHHPKTNNGTGPVSKSLISLAMMGYRTFVSEVLDFEITRVKKNVSIFNSHLTEREFEKLYGANSGHVVYPPVVIERTASKPFSEREDGFIYSGRVVRDKNIHRMIEFLEKVRAGGIEVHFHVVGPTPDGEYKRELQEKYPHGWITFEGNKSRAELSEILGRHKYAIQARYLEPFGMAAAEAAKLGCLTFVPKRSGFAELLEDDSLKFDDFAELNHKFSQLWSDKELQETISDKLRRQFVEFTPEVFQSQIQSIFLESVKQLDV